VIRALREATMRRLELLASLLASTALLGTGGARAQGAPRIPGSARGGTPNIVVESDQHRAGMTKATGYPLDTSPELDAMAERGVRFDNAYATAPLCVPSRVSMLTGRWPAAHRVRMNLAGKDAFYTRDVYDVAKAQGYRTGLAGKNHTYLRSESLDFWRSYSHTSGYRAPNADPSHAASDAWMERLRGGAISLEPTPFPPEAQFPYRIVSDAIEFIDGSGNQPFLLQVSLPEPIYCNRCPIPIGTWSRPTRSRPAPPDPKRSRSTLNKVTQSGNAAMVRMGEWKLIYDMMGYGQLYHLPSDPLELDNRFGQSDVGETQSQHMGELAMWTLRTQDSLPTGPQNAKCQTKWGRPHNWYEPHRKAPAGTAYIP
jgi:hypothetical protein